MKTNVGGWDRNIRWMVGSAALVAGVLAPIRLPWRISLLALGASNLFSAGTRYCPVNEILGVNTATQDLKEEVRSAAQSLAE